MAICLNRKSKVEDNKVMWLEGNPHLLQGALCAKGSAGPALVADRERPQQPLIRRGGRGAGRWEEVSWEFALDYVADKMKGIIEHHGPEAIMASSRGGPWRIWSRPSPMPWVHPITPTMTAPAAAMSTMQEVV